MSLEEERSRLTTEDAALPWHWAPRMHSLTVFKGFPPNVRWEPELKETILSHCGSSGRLPYDTRTEIGDEDSVTYVIHPHSLLAVEMHPDLETFLESYGIDMEAMRDEANRRNERAGVLELLRSLEGEEFSFAASFLASWDMMHGDPISNEDFKARKLAFENWVKEWRAVENKN